MERPVHVWRILFVPYENLPTEDELTVYWDPETENASHDIAEVAQIQFERPIAGAEYVGVRQEALAA